jgi:hypothetical protein
MISGNVQGGELGNPMVWTSNNRGHTPEEIADMHINRFIYIADSAPSVIRDQARQFKEQIKQELVNCIKKGIQSDRTTIYNTLIKEGLHNEAEAIRRL